MRKLGVIGGLGPMATALFMKMVIEMTEAEKDQDHIEMLVYNCPKIPDRTSFLLGESADDPSPKMIEIGRKLAGQGAEVIAIPCITANYFYPVLKSAIPVKIINVIEEIVTYVKQKNYRCVGVMATTGTIQCGIFQKAFLDSGCSLVFPSDERQQDVMHVIYQNIKVNKEVELERFEEASSELRELGAQLIILGCTELSVVRENYPIGGGYLDAMQLMAKCAVEACGTLREDYRELVV